MILTTRKTFLMCSVIAALATVKSQAQVDTSFVRESIIYAVGLHEKDLERQHRYFTGSVYLEPVQTNEEHPFYRSDQWDFGSIVFDGQPYRDIPLLYDLASDKIVSESPTGGMFAIASHRLSSFIIHHAKFEKIYNERVGNSLPRSGFYEVLYGGKSKLISHRLKIRQEEVNNQGIQVHFEEKFRYYVMKDNVFHAVRSKAQILKVLGDRKAELRSFISKHRLNFSATRESSLAKLVSYYDELKSVKP